MAKKKISVLITGALGHIGSRLMREMSPELISKIFLLDNLESQKHHSLFNLPHFFDYRFIEDDIRTVNFNTYLRNTDMVIHLAALTNAETSHERSEEVDSVNARGLKRLADYCLKHKVKLLFPSTTSVYGSQASRVDEDCQELRPQSPYAQSKLEAEQYLKKLGKRGLKFVVCRFGTIFGYSVGMRFHTAVNKFIWQAINDVPLSVWKTAWKQKRPYLDLGDCIRAVNLIIQKDIFNGQTYNILTTNFTVEDVVNVIKIYRPDLRVDFVDSRIMNQLSYEVDDSKFRKLGFKPKGDLRRGIQETFKELQGNHADLIGFYYTYGN